MNWGNKLLVTIIVFVSGMCYLVYRSVGTNYEMVEDNYYNNELHYQQTIDAFRNAGNLVQAPSLKQENGHILLQLPGEMKHQAISGDILFYCPYDEKKDRRFDLRVNETGLQQLGGAVLPGSYLVKIHWACSGKNYYTEKSFTVL